LLLDQIEKEDRLFAALCIWWLASVIQFTDILTYYRLYKKIPSEVIRDCVVTPLPTQETAEALIPESNIPALDINQYSDILGSNHNINSDIEVHPS